MTVAAGGAAARAAAATWQLAWRRRDAAAAVWGGGGDALGAMLREPASGQQRAHLPPSGRDGKGHSWILTQRMGSRAAPQVHATVAAAASAVRARTRTAQSSRTAGALRPFRLSQCT
jgi:hypothetical protein